MADRPYRKDGLLNGSDPLVFELAKRLRNTMTDAEVLLWQYLKNGIQSLKFRRQHPVGIYIADFYCHRIKLIIETDGTIHNIPEVKSNDEERQRTSESNGFHVIRFTNHQVLKEIESVLNTIQKSVEKLLSKINIH